MGGKRFKTKNKIIIIIKTCSIIAYLFFFCYIIYCLIYYNQLIKKIDQKQIYLLISLRCATTEIIEYLLILYVIVDVQ
jgi:hypothetical protein